MSNLSISFTEKQREAYHTLMEDGVSEVLFGGGAGGGKSWWGCSLLVMFSIAYPGTRWVMGRSVLKTLKETTLKTFFQVCKASDIKSGVHYEYKKQEGLIVWYNGSEILLKDLFRYPSDPEFDELGSLEITGGFIDEANQVVELAKSVLKSRMRYKHDEYGIGPKLWMSCNPAKNRVYTEYYQPRKLGQQKKGKAFVPALVTDNPMIESTYIANLDELPEAQRKRLRDGDRKYDNTPGRLFKYDALLDLFTNPVNNGDKYIICDPARQGKDRAVIYVFNGWEEVEKVVYDKCSLDEIENKIKELSQRHNIPMRNVLVDDDGLGGGIVDNLKCVGFQNNARPIDNVQGVKANFQNLKTQCYYTLGTIVEESKLRLKEDQYKDDIVQELDAIVEVDIDKDSKRKIISKDKIKEKIGRSPDFADCLAMRCYFELRPKVTPVFFSL